MTPMAKATKAKKTYATTTRRVRADLKLLLGRVSGACLAEGPNQEELICAIWSWLVLEDPKWIATKIESHVETYRRDRELEDHAIVGSPIAKTIPLPPVPGMHATTEPAPFTALPPKGPSKDKPPRRKKGS